MKKSEGCQWCADREVFSVFKQKWFPESLEFHRWCGVFVMHYFSASLQLEHRMSTLQKRKQRLKEQICPVRFLDLNSDLSVYRDSWVSATAWPFGYLTNFPTAQVRTFWNVLQQAEQDPVGQEYRSQWAWWHSVSHEGNDLAHRVVLGDRPEQKSGAYREDCIQLEVRTTPSLRPYWFQDCNQDERGRRQQSFPEECRWQIILNVPGEAGCTTMWMQLMAMNCTLKNGWNGKFYLVYILHTHSHKVSRRRKKKNLWLDQQHTQTQETSNIIRLKDVWFHPLDSGPKKKKSIFATWLDMPWDLTKEEGPKRSQ